MLADFGSAEGAVLWPGDSSERLPWLAGELVTVLLTTLSSEFRGSVLATPFLSFLFLEKRPLNTPLLFFFSPPSRSSLLPLRDFFIFLDPSSCEGLVCVELLAAEPVETTEVTDATDCPLTLRCMVCG